MTNEDPLRPGLETPTPADVVARLPQPYRIERVQYLIEQSDYIMETALEKFGAEHQIMGTCVLFSGGNDSTVLAHLMRKHATHAIHCNTTIGIEDTRQFVRDTCAEWGLPLMEEIAPTTYRDLVLEQGFPGPGHHFKMFQRLKERGLRQARRKLVTRPRRERVLFVAGRRRQESARRANIPLYERVDSTIWASPIALWTKLDMMTYRLMNREVDPVPVNQVSDLLHMSGECLCGSFAKAGELDEIEMWFPDVAEYIRDLEAEIADRPDIPERRKKWGWGAYADVKPSKKVGSLCTSCNAPDGGTVIRAA
ncbi:hypothetical protein A5630_25355 [Mycolicibacterium mucogenicum]|uniref:Phosphoadenosine phosphosulphate reductase domain-containing protein n=1 Tax=Mycolicibacterium mucogenicum TaxID=56689 RepID=A0A1A3GY31_MYCMU|nr:phosphoadenosine phosphosulfate reductase family protein [Mycolicibacterium mucogenicum]OBJ40281.1 hypothetical protein A5630_25355 [Mycolicibacterium mucogenicum]